MCYMQKNGMYLLPLKDTFIFPYEQQTIFVSRNISLNVINEVMKNINDTQIIITAQMNSDDINSIIKYGTICKIIKVNYGDILEVELLALKRVQLESINFLDILSASYVEIKENIENDFFDFFKYKIMEILEITKNLQSLYEELLLNYNNQEKFIFILASFVLSKKQKLHMAGLPLNELYQECFISLKKQVNLLKIENDIEEKVQKQISGQQVELWIKSQMKILPTLSNREQEQKNKNNKKEKDYSLIPLYVTEKIQSEQEKLQHLPQFSIEAALIKQYIDILYSIPWNKSSSLQSNLKNSIKILNESHYGLEEIKESILQCINLNNYKPNRSPEIILLIGPPGVGKTSICASIARATGRTLCKISLAGNPYTSALLGFPRTYVGSNTGRFIKSLIDAQSNNVLFLLDEVDKINKDNFQDPSRALLSILDSEQNDKIIDLYVEIPMDFSKCMFILTANYEESIAPELLNRVHKIYLDGYSPKEKEQISEFILKQELERVGLKVKFSKELINYIVVNYTLETGVRELKRQFRQICEKLLLQKTLEEKLPKINKSLIDKYLKIKVSQTLIKGIGISYGLAYTNAGGVVISIESLFKNGTGQLIITGNLGKTLEESVKCALTHLNFKIPMNEDLHIHIPNGVKKDGPSAGIAIYSSLWSLIYKKEIPFIAMTGEISLNGYVLPVGGLKHKINGAINYLFKKVVIPNQQIVLSKDTKDQIEIYEINHVNELNKLLENKDIL